MQDLDREVLAALAEDLLNLLCADLARAMMRIDDVVAELELDVLGHHLDCHIISVRIDLGVELIVDVELNVGVGIEPILEQVCFSCFGNLCFLLDACPPTPAAG